MAYKVAMEGPRSSSPSSSKTTTTTLASTTNREDNLNQLESGPAMGDSDQDIPYHTYRPKVKMLLVIVVSCVGSLSGLSSNVYFPAQAEISAGLGVSKELVNLSITTYMIAQGLGPSIWAPLADRQGRRLTFIYTLLLYAGANVALALSTNGAMLLIFRALQAFGSSSTIALGAGVIADISAPQERGSYLGWFSGGRQISLAAGPILGGLLAGSCGWRSIFWFLLGLSGACLLLVILLLPETLRRIAGNGSTVLPRMMHRPLLDPVLHLTGRHNTDEVKMWMKESEKEIKSAPPFTWKIFIEPFKLLLDADTFCAVIFGGCVYTAWSMMLASTTYIFEQVYGFTTMQIGFCLLANGLGCVCGSIIAGRSLNTDFSREGRLWQHARNQHPDTPLPSKPLPPSFPLEQARLRKGRIYTIAAIWSLLLFGWSLTAPGPSNDPKAHWMTPLLAQFAAGWSATSVLTCNNALIVDLYPGRSATASAILNLGRCLLGAAGVAAVEPFLRVSNPGWMSVLLAGIVGFGLVLYVLHCHFGQRWRARREIRKGESDRNVPK